MFFTDGRSPDDLRAGSARQRLHAIAGTIILTGLFGSITATAQSQATLTIGEAEDLALAAEPGQQALRTQAAALEERAIAAGDLPEPTLRVGINNFPIESGGFRTEGMTSATIGMRQAFPAGKTRAVSARQFNWQATEMTENAEARGRDVLAAARRAWLDVYFWQRTYDLVAESRPFLEDLVAVTRSLYSVGRKSQQDVLRAELELSRLEDRLIDSERQRSRAKAALSEWLGADAMRPVAASLPGWDELPTLESLQSRLSEHPVVRAADAEIAARNAGVDLAMERTKPGWALDLGYSYREGSLPTGEPRSDFVSLGLTVDLPMFRKTSVDSNLSAALHERSAAKSNREQRLRSLDSQLAAEHARWRDLSRRLALYESRILDQAKNHAEASMLAYQSDRADFADVMQSYIAELNTRVDHIRLQVERAQSYALLANLGGLPR